MSTRHSRRGFLKRSALLTGAVAGASLLRVPAVIAAESLKEKVRVAIIGCGGQGTGTHVPNVVREKLVALVDPDANCIAKAMRRATSADGSLDASKIRTFADYREMFDAMAKDIDAVSVVTPNHHHALASLIAMKLGKHVYVEKPMAYDIAECRLMAETARKSKVITQMGNQGHSGEGYRRLCEYIWAGAIGKVTEVYHWSDRANGGMGQAYPTLPVPEGMKWDNWIGPAPYCEYHKDLHPHEWHNWWDYGNSSIGNMGCHVMDGAEWALKLGHPTSIECEDMLGGGNGQYPVGTRIRYDYPARGDMPPVKVWWYDGRKRGVADPGRGDTAGTVGRQGMNLPPLVVELQQKYSRNFGGNGTLYVGDKGVMFTGTYGDGVRIVPEEAQKAFRAPDKTLPRVKGNHFTNFYDSCRSGEPAVSNFDVASSLTEKILLGCLAVKAGVGKKVEWDGPGMRCTNMPEVNKYIRREYRKGWEA